jgi:hypothetical protein
MNQSTAARSMNIIRVRRQRQKQRSVRIRQHTVIDTTCCCINSGTSIHLKKLSCSQSHCTHLERIRRLRPLLKVQDSQLAACGSLRSWHCTIAAPNINMLSSHTSPARQSCYLVVVAHDFAHSTGY